MTLVNLLHHIHNERNVKCCAQVSSVEYSHSHRYEYSGCGFSQEISLSFPKRRGNRVAHCRKRYFNGILWLHKSTGRGTSSLLNKYYSHQWYPFLKAIYSIIHLTFIFPCNKNSGSKLRTATLRPTVLYGELDPYFIPTGMRVAKSCFGYLPRPLALIQESQFQATYAGNAAWAHLLAAWKLRVGEKLDKEVDGETFYVSDETEIGSIYDFMRPFLLLKGYKILNVWIPLFLILTGLQVFSWFVEKVFPIGWKKRLNKHPVIPTYQSFRMAHSELTLSKFKGKDRLGYEPIYSPGEAKMNSAKYYKSLQV